MNLIRLSAKTQVCFMMTDGQFVMSFCNWENWLAYHFRHVFLLIEIYFLGMRADTRFFLHMRIINTNPVTYTQKHTSFESIRLSIFKNIVRSFICKNYYPTHKNCGFLFDLAHVKCLLSTYHGVTPIYWQWIFNWLSKLGLQVMSTGGKGNWLNF